MTRLLLLSAVAALAALAVGSVSAGAGGASAFVCSGNFFNPVVNGDVVVPTGADCELNGTGKVTGNVRVESGGRFGSEVDIDGNVVGEPGNSGVLLAGDVVGGNVKVDDGVLLEIHFAAHVRGNVDANDTAGVHLHTASVVDGNVSITDTPAPADSDTHVDLEDLTVGGNVQLLDNHLTVVLFDNQFGRNLICFRNDGVSSSGALAVKGKKLGQCAGL
jgi:hypothetical protein